MQAHGAKLSVWQLVMLGLGTVIGGSFFLGTAIPLREAGAGTLLVFAAGGFVVYLILTALSELTVGRPAHGSFREYAEVAFGPMASFLVGWLYWIGLVLALSSEATATALFARYFAPGLPLWVVSLAVIIGVTLINLLDVRMFSLVESVMAGVKLLAIVGFILVMASLVLGLLPGRPPAGLERPLIPGGAGGLAGSMLLVLFSYAGFEVMGLAAPDAKDPQRTVPRAVILTVISLVTLYVLSMAVILPVLPRRTLGAEVSPMVETLRLSGLPGLSAAFNLIVMSASLSTMLAAMYGLGRMLYSLAEEGQAPALFKRLTPAGAPRNAMLASGVGMLVGVVLAYILPKSVYVFLVSSSGFAILVAYLSILASQLVIRRREGCPKGGCQMPWYPYGTWLGIIALVGAILSMPLIPGQGAGLIMGISLLAALSLIYWLTHARSPEPTETPDDDLLLR